MLWSFFMLALAGPGGDRRSGDLRLAHEGSPEDLARYLEGLRPAALRMVARVSGDLATEAADITQTAYASMLAKEAASFRNYRGDAELKTLVLRVVQRKAQDRLRQLARSPFEPLPDNEDQVAGPSEDNPAHVALAVDQAARISAAIDRLNPRQQQAIRLFYFAGQKCDQIAQALGVERGRAAAILCEARTSLRPILLRLLDEDDYSVRGSDSDKRAESIQAHRRLS